MLLLLLPFITLLLKSFFITITVQWPPKYRNGNTYLKVEKDEINEDKKYKRPFGQQLTGIHSFTFFVATNFI